MNKWHKSEWLPMIGERVIVTTARGEIQTASLIWELEDGRHGRSGDFENGYIRAWTEAPEPYKGG